MASTHTARVPADTLDDEMRRRGRVVVRVPGCKCEFSVEPGKVIFHDGEGTNFVMYPKRDFYRDSVLCSVDTTRYRATATQVGYHGEAEFTVTDLWGSTPVPQRDSHDDAYWEEKYAEAFNTPINEERKKVLLLCR